MRPRDPTNHPLAVFARARAQGRPVQVAGPMVRYSKLPFRETVHALSPHETTLVYSPMILAREFVRSPWARAADFSTSEKDVPLIVQFGANNSTDMSRAARLIQPYCDGISLNCGCPIRDQVREGIGAALMSKPHRVVSLIRAAKRACGSEFCVEAKIRIHTDLAVTIRFARMIEAAGADYITVHGRRQTDRSSLPANQDAIRIVKEAISIPVVANGDYFEPSDLMKIAEATGADGVMSARGILENPGLFGGWATCPWRAIELFWAAAMRDGLSFHLLHHHLSLMTEKSLSKSERKEMLESRSNVELLNWFDTYFDLRRPTDVGFATRDEWPYRSREIGLCSSFDNLSMTPSEVIA